MPPGKISRLQNMRKNRSFLYIMHQEQWQTRSPKRKEGQRKRRRKQGKMKPGAPGHRQLRTSYIAQNAIPKLIAKQDPPRTTLALRTRQQTRWHSCYPPESVWGSSLWMPENMAGVFTSIKPVGSYLWAALATTDPSKEYGSCQKIQEDDLRILKPARKDPAVQQLGRPWPYELPFASGLPGHTGNGKEIRINNLSALSATGRAARLTHIPGCSNVWHDA